MRSALLAAVLLAAVGGCRRGEADPGAKALPTGPIASESCARIKPGMTHQEVVEVMGGPPGFYEGLVGISSDAPVGKKAGPSWAGRQGEVYVELDESGKVLWVKWFPAKRIWLRFDRPGR